MNARHGNVKDGLYACRILMQRPITQSIRYKSYNCEL